MMNISRGGGVKWPRRAARMGLWEACTAPQSEILQMKDSLVDLYIYAKV